MASTTPTRTNDRTREIAGEIVEVFRGHYGGSAFDWGEGSVYVRLDADRFFTYSRTPKDFPA